MEAFRSTIEDCCLGDLGSQDPSSLGQIRGVMTISPKKVLTELWLTMDGVGCIEGQKLR